MSGLALKAEGALDAVVADEVQVLADSTGTEDVTVADFQDAAFQLVGHNLASRE